MSLLSNPPQPCWLHECHLLRQQQAGLQTAARQTRTHQRHASLRATMGQIWICYQHFCMPSFRRGHLADALASPVLLQVFPYVSGCISDYMTIPSSPLWSGILAALLLMMLRSGLLRRDKPLHMTLWVRLPGCAGLPGCAVPGCPLHLELLVAMEVSRDDVSADRSPGPTTCSRCHSQCGPPQLVQSPYVLAPRITALYVLLTRPSPADMSLCLCVCPLDASPCKALHLLPVIASCWQSPA